MSALQLTLTNAGLAALVNNQNNGSATVVVASVGFASIAFTPSAVLTGVPNEVKRITTISGGASGPDTIHVTVQDMSSDTYSVRGFGLYSSDNVLLATYAQPGVIIEKSAQAQLLLSTDMRFVGFSGGTFTFGDPTFINPAATEATVGVSRFATNAEDDAGASSNVAATPKGIARYINARFGVGAPSDFVRSLLAIANAELFRSTIGLSSVATKQEGHTGGIDADLLDGQHGSFYRAWGSLVGVPLSFPPSIHGHSWGDLTGIPATATRWPSWGEVTDKPASFTPSAHTHDASAITSGTFIDARVAQSNVKQHEGALAIAWTQITGRPATYPPSAHSHVIGDVTGLSAALDAKAAIAGQTFTGAVNAPSFGITSDATLKEAIADLPDGWGLRTVLAMRPRSYRWKTDGSPDVGFIAQEFREVLPRAVNLGDDGILRIHYGRSEPILAKAIQELASMSRASQLEVEDLRRRVSELERRRNA